MMTKRQSIETFLVIVIGAIAVIFVTVQRNDTANRSLNSSAAIPVEVTPIPQQIPQVTTMDSPEGSKTLTIKKEDDSYIVSTTIKSEGNTLTIFKEGNSANYTLEIPFNTWSPNAEYFFLDKKTQAMHDYLVFQSEGNAFSNGSHSLSIQEHFKEKLPNYIIEDVTGWADNTLIIVNTKVIGADTRVSFWFDVTSQTFIRLNTYFK